MKKKGKGNSKYCNYILIYSGKNQNERAASGVGLFIHKKYEDNIEEVQYISDRLLQVTLIIKARVKLNILSIYAPDITKPQDEKDDFYATLQQTIDRIPTNEEIIALGDFNARIGNEILSGIKNRFNESTLNDSGEQLIQFCTQNQLRINNTFFEHKPQHQCTFTNSRGQKSTIDYIISNRSIHPSKILDVRVLSSANVGTDHNLVLMKLRHSNPKKQKRPPLLIEKFNTESLQDPSVRHLYKSRLNQKIHENKIDEGDSIDSAWNKLLSNILRAAEESIGKRKTDVNSQKRNMKPWFSDDVKELAATKRKTYLKFRQKTITYADYKAIRNTVNSQISDIKKAYWEKFSMDMEHDLYGAQKKVWGMLRNRKKPINEYLTFSKITILEWEKYFNNLYNSMNQNNTNHTYTRTHNSNLTNEKYTISFDEVERATLKLKNRKSAGPDEICNEMIKYGGEQLTTELANLFEKILEVKKVPSMWKESTTIPIYKKGDKQTPENYRGITLLSAVLKLFTKIIATQIAKTGISEEQQGFRQNRSTTDAIFIIKQIAEKAIEFNKPVFLCFIDLTQAFDRVLLHDVLNILVKRNVDNHITAVVEDLNTNNTTTIKVKNRLSDKIHVASGIRQGDSLSPILFNTIMDEIIADIKQSTAKGFKLHQTEFKVICYADDAVLLSDNEDDLQRMLFTFEKSAAKYNMRISVEKTKCLTISRHPLRCKLAVYNKSVEQVMEFKYLGANITSSRDLTREVKAQAIKASCISGYLRDIVWKNKHMSMRGKIRIYKTCVRPIMTYGVETRADTLITQRIINSTEMQTLRAISGYTRLDHQRNEDIRRICEIEDVTKWSRQRRKEWNRHVRRMDVGRLAKAAMLEKPNTTRPPGRPPRRWHECWTSGSRSD